MANEWDLKLCYWHCRFLSLYLWSLPPHLLLVLSGSYVLSVLCLMAACMGSISQLSDEGGRNLSKLIYTFPSVVILATINELSYWELSIFTCKYKPHGNLFMRTFNHSFYCFKLILFIIFITTHNLIWIWWIIKFQILLVCMAFIALFSLFSNNDIIID